MKKISAFCLFAATGVISSLLCAPCIGQSFSVDTTTTQFNGAYDYAFTLNYDQAGQVQGLTDNIWEWSFYLDPNTPIPTDISSPIGWESLYTPETGEFDWYTEGPNGFAGGDFGTNVIISGNSLNGFQLTTPLSPDLSLATAYDEQFNSDISLAILPVAPAAVPEASTWQSLGSFLLLGLPLAARGKWQQRNHRSSK